MKFVHKNEEYIAGETTFSISDESIEFTAQKSSELLEPSTASLIVAGTIQIEFSTHSGRLLHVWGYSPREQWTRLADALEINARAGAVYLTDLNTAGSGEGYNTVLTDATPTYYEGSGHLLIGDYQVGNTLIEIASGAFISLDGNDLQGVIVYLQKGL
ncbi:MAG TPA: hypothetical protein VD735_04445 [Candidatus Saccharimonadales bacterium]|nr:hypothetical protein [Candidatus Saccharimonadales bacterium]